MKMNRGSFLKRLFSGAVVAAVAPSAFINKENTKFVDADDLKKEAVKKIIPWRANDEWGSHGTMCMGMTGISSLSVQEGELRIYGDRNDGFRFPLYGLMG